MIIRKAVTGAGWGETIRPDTLTIYKDHLYIYADERWYSLGNEGQLIESHPDIQTKLNEMTGKT